MPSHSHCLNPYSNPTLITAGISLNRVSILSLADFILLDDFFGDSSPSHSDSDSQCSMVRNLRSFINFYFNRIILFQYYLLLQWEECLLPMGWLAWRRGIKIGSWSELAIEPAAQTRKLFTLEDRKLNHRPEIIRIILNRSQVNSHHPLTLGYDILFFQ